MPALLLAAACSGDGPPPTAASGTSTVSESAPREASARYQLRFEDVAVGTTELSVRRQVGGYRLRRDDRISLNRGSQRVDSVTTVVVDTDAALVATEVSVHSRVGSTRRETVAVRDEGGWSIRSGTQTIARRSGLEIAEVALFFPDRARKTEPMLLAGASFAIVSTGVSSEGGGRYRVTFSSEMGAAEVGLDIAGDGLPREWHATTGESAIRTDVIANPSEPAELLMLASMPARGRRSGTLRVSGVDRAPPPSFGQQRVEVGDAGWVVSFVDRSHPLPSALSALVVGVDERIEDDLGVPGLSGTEALRMGRGDCSGHASALAVLAERAGYRAKVATGYRRTGSHWLRHRWTLIEVGGEWVSVDPSFGEAQPARGRLLVMAIHEPTPEAMALADLVAFAGMSEASAEYISR